MAVPLDGIIVAVPAHWDAPGAGAIPTLRNKAAEQGRLEAVPADIGELLTAGMMLPGALFGAQGSAVPGMYAMLQVRSQGRKAVWIFAALLAALSIYWFR
ncbi:MAG TPA: hypothetical protein VJS45_14955 [Acidimicrobiia bacterium]|nr:hypothetical protein [Acidimicrobiia bacterium]